MSLEIPPLPSPPVHRRFHRPDPNQIAAYEQLKKHFEWIHRLEGEKNRHKASMDLRHPMDACTQEKDGYDRYKIICPYCLKKFEIGSLLYRATPREDPNGKAIDCFEPENDAQYAEFWKKMGVNDIEPLQKHILDADPAHGEIASVTFELDQPWNTLTLPYNDETRKQMFRDKVRRVEDKYGNVTSERICPECHTPLPGDIGFCPNYIYSFMGNSSCGKTVYLNRLILTLTSGGFLNGDYYGMGANDGMAKLGETALDGARALFTVTGQSLAEATDVGYIPPTILRLEHTGSGERFFITLFDYPGEAIWKDDDAFFQPLAERVRQNSDGLILMFDSGVTLNRYLPDQYKTELQLESEGNNPANASASQVIRHIYANTFHGSVVGKPVALVLSKSDLIKYYLEQSGGDLPSFLSPVFPHQTLDLSDLHRCHQEVEAFLNQHDIGTTGTAKVMCRGNSAWFAVSSTGTPLVDGTIQEGAQVNGLRETDPLEWLLYRNGHLKADFRADDKVARRWAAGFQVDAYHKLQEMESELESACQEYNRLFNAYNDRCNNA